MTEPMFSIEELSRLKTIDRCIAHADKTGAKLTNTLSSKQVRFLRYLVERLSGGVSVPPGAPRETTALPNDGEYRCCDECAHVFSPADLAAEPKGWGHPCYGTATRGLSGKRVACESHRRIVTLQFAAAPPGDVPPPMIPGVTHDIDGYEWNQSQPKGTGDVPPPPRWQPIETAPPGETLRYGKSFYTDCTAMWVGDGTERWHWLGPTHWMPLPDPPAALPGDGAARPSQK